MRRSTSATAIVILLAIAGIATWTALRQVDRLASTEARLDAFEAVAVDLGKQIEEIQSRLDALESGEAPGPENAQTVSLPLFYIETTDEGTDYRPVAVERRVPRLESAEKQIEAAFAALVAGPTLGEVESHGRNVSNLIPEETRVRAVTIEGDTAIVDLSREFERVGGTARIDGMLQQVTYTVTAFDGIDAVRLLIEGERVGTTDRPFTGDGFLFGALRREEPLISS